MGMHQVLTDLVAGGQLVRGHRHEDYYAMIRADGARYSVSKAIGHIGLIKGWIAGPHGSTRLPYHITERGRAVQRQGVPTKMTDFRYRLLSSLADRTHRIVSDPDWDHRGYFVQSRISGHQWRVNATAVYSLVAYDWVDDTGYITDAGHRALEAETCRRLAWQREQVKWATPGPRGD